MFQYSLFEGENKKMQRKKNNIEGTPILKLAMVKRLQVKKFVKKNRQKNLSKKWSKNSSKNFVKKIVKFLRNPKVTTSST